MSDKEKSYLAKSKSIMAILSSVIAILGFVGISNIYDLINLKPQNNDDQVIDKKVVNENDNTIEENMDDSSDVTITDSPQIIKSDPIELVNIIENVSGYADNSIKSSVKDTFGNEYHNCIISRPSLANSKSKIMYSSPDKLPFVMMNDTHDYLTGIITPVDGFDNSHKISVKIYNENEKLLYSTNVERNTQPQKINVKIKGSHKIYIMILAPTIQLSYVALADMVVK